MKKVIFYTQAYHAEKTLPRAIESILAQTRPEWQYFILDNGSKDETSKIINQYAAQDERIIPLIINENNPMHGGMLFFNVFPNISDADYFIWLDADDAYSPDFLEKMIPFAEENHLDIASCGYDSIDGLTGRQLKRRISPRNIILYGNQFAEQFIDYRSFLMIAWGKLYSGNLLRKVFRSAPLNTPYRMYSDSVGTMTLFRNADRVGIYGEALYQYYQYPNSLSRINLNGNIAGCQKYFFEAKRYLEHYGPISRTNEDFLYAIYLSMVDETVERVFSADLPAAQKLELLRQTFQEPLWAETLARKADPQFRNLAARREYVAQMKGRILALPATPEERELAEAAVRELDKPIFGAPA